MSDPLLAMMWRKALDAPSARDARTQAAAVCSSDCIVGVPRCSKNSAITFANCLALAADAEQRAAEAHTEALRVDYERLARTWRHLANSYQFVQSLECFLLDSDKARRARPADPANENGGRVRPLGGTTFDPETIAMLTAAYYKAIEGQPAFTHEIIAKCIIELASAGERDQDKLCHGALVLLMREPRSGS